MSRKKLYEEMMSRVMRRSTLGNMQNGSTKNH